MAVDEVGDLYVGGNFGSAGGNEASRIARWNGNEWSTLGEGTSGFVQSILVTEDYVYAGGNFAIAGNQTVNRIARWDRSSAAWTALNDGLSNSVNAITTDGEYLYVGGQFSNALNTGSTDDIIVNGVVQWSEASGWQALGEGTAVGVDNYVNTLSINGSQLYAGGRFEVAGDLGTRNLATWLPPQPPVASVLFEAGKIDIQQSSRSFWQTVNLTKTFSQPVVVISPPTYNGSQPTTVRVRNVSSGSFEVQLNEWDYLDGQHLTESLNYLVIEAGTHTLAGLQIEAGKLTTDESFKTQTFAQDFSSPPIVLVQCASDNEASATAPRLRNIATGSFEVRLQEEEAADDLRVDESIHYVALMSGAGNEADWSVEAALAGNDFTHQWQTVDFGDGYVSPLFFAALQSYRGSGPATLRYRSLSSTGVALKVEEEQSEDSEVNHVDETVAYLVLDQSSANTSSRTSLPSLSSASAPLYPNPVRVGQDILLKDSPTEQRRLTIFNAQGQKVFEQNTKNQRKVGTIGWRPGLYFIRWQSQRGVQTQRLLVVE